MTNFKQLISWGIRGAVILGTIVVTAYSEGLGKGNTGEHKPGIIVPSSFITSPDDMAIKELLKASQSYWADWHKMDVANKISQIATKEGQTSYTKALAISALGDIRDELWSESYKTEVTELIVGIL